MIFRHFSYTSILILCIFSIVCDATSFAQKESRQLIDTATISEEDANVAEKNTEIEINSSDVNVDNINVDTDMYASDSNELIDEIDIASLTEDTDLKFEKIDSLEPTLLITGKFDKSSSQKQKVELKGRIIPERHPIGRRRYVYRWILKLQDGSRVPLKSNLTLLQKVKDDDVLDGFVSIKGTWLIAPSNENLKFFKIDSMRVIDEPAQIEEDIQLKETVETADIAETDAITDKTNNTDLNEKNEKTQAISAIDASSTLEIVNKDTADDIVDKINVNDELIKNKEVIDNKSPLGTDRSM